MSDFKNCKTISLCCVMSLNFCVLLQHRQETKTPSSINFCGKKLPPMRFMTTVYKSLNSQFLVTIIEDADTLLSCISHSPILPEVHHLCSALDFVSKNYYLLLLPNFIFIPEPTLDRLTSLNSFGSSSFCYIYLVNPQPRINLTVCVLQLSC